MIKKLLKSLWPLLLLLIITLLVYFRPLWQQGLIPFPGHLLVSFFSPFKEETWPAYPVGIPRKDLLGFDTVRQIYPWLKFSFDQIKSGQLPLWNPHNLAGNPHLANFQTAIFYPLNWLYLLLSPQIAWTILIILQPLIAAAAAYFWLKKLKLKPLACLFGALTYGFSGWLSVWLEWNIHGHIYALIPLALLGIELLRQQATKTRITLNLFILVLIIFAGNPQMALYVLALYAAYFHLRLRDKSQLLVPIIFLAFGLTALQWLPTVELYLHSSRGAPAPDFDFAKNFLPLTHLIRLWAPNFFGHPATGNYWGSVNFVETTMYAGAITALLALSYLWLKKDSLGKFFLALGAIILLVSLPLPIGQLIGVLKIPIISSSVITRIFIFFPLVLTVLACLSLDKLLSRQPSFAFIKNLTVLIFVILSLSWGASLVLPRLQPDASWLASLSVARRNLVIPTGLSLVFLFSLIFIFKTKIKTRLILPLFLLLTLADLGRFAYKTLTFTESDFIFPSPPVLNFLQQHSGYHRYAAEPDSGIESNLATFYHINSIEGYEPLYNRRYAELVWSAWEGQYTDSFSRTTVHYPSEKTSARNKLLNLLSAKYYLVKTDYIPNTLTPDKLNLATENFQLVFDQDKWRVYENLQAFPKAKLFSQAKVINSDEEIISYLYSEAFDPTQELILETPLPSDFNLVPASQGQVDIKAYRPNRLTIVTSTDTDQILYLTDNFFPGWKANIDGQSARIYRANYTFRAILLPAGEHSITMHYQPLSFTLGLIISFLGLGGTIIWLKRKAR